MRQVIMAAIALLAIAAAGRPACAQDSAAFRMGAGISIDPALFGSSLIFGPPSGPSPGSILISPLYSTAPFDISLPMVIAGRFRIEPRFGIYSFSNETTYSTSPTQPEKNDFSLTHIGCALEYLLPLGERARLSAGPRVGINFTSTTSVSYGYYTGGSVPVKVTSTSSETDWVLTALLGGEFFPVRDLSIGGEINVNYVTFGNPDYSQNPPPPYPQSTVTRTQSLVTTGGIFYLRWYFF